MMEKITLTIKDNSKIHFFLELLKQFDFIEVQKPSLKKSALTDKYDLFASAGRWKDRDIDSQDLREKAWRKAS